MALEHAGTLIIGGGQAGIAMSEHLSKHGVAHLVVEKDRIAESWRTRRWDSLVANGPAWHDRFPGLTFSDLDQDSFASKDRIVDYFESYARQIEAPIRCGVTVLELHSKADGGFMAETSQGPIEADNVVVATGAFQRPAMPAAKSDVTGVTQLHSNDYRNPWQLPNGAVLVVGAGSSGVQIADELLRAGRRVYLSVGRHSRPPRRYRGMDFCWWLGTLGKWDARSTDPNTAHVTIAVSGARGGHTVDFRELASRGVTLTGEVLALTDGVARFAPDLVENITLGDDDFLSLLDEADAYVEKMALDLPEEREARRILPDPPCMTSPLLELDLAEAGVAAVVWATGFESDFSWLKADVLDDRGRPKHKNGITSVPGLYFLGLPWLTRRASAFIWGVWTDAAGLADDIAVRSGMVPRADADSVDASRVASA